MIRLSIPVREALSRLTLPALVVAAFALMLLGKVDAVLAGRARMALDDLLAPLDRVAAQPMVRLRATLADARDLMALRAENDRLRAENARLRHWQAAALSLAREDAALKAELHWIPDPAPGFVTARVLADAGGVYARSVLVAADRLHPVARGEVVLDGRGLVGRVSDVGARSARILLITDLRSRVPVKLEESHGRAMLAGTNGGLPRLLYWPQSNPPVEGERVLTSAEGGAYPAGLPVGIVHYTADRIPEVEPFAKLGDLEMVRIVDYGLHGLLPPAPARVATESLASSAGRSLGHHP